MDFTAIDFETANRQRGSVCAVGITQVRGGRIIETTEWLVIPPTGLAAFDDINISIHGITPELAASGSSWTDSLARIETLAGGGPLVAFNVPFDRSVMKGSSEVTGLNPLSNPWHCALELSRRHLTLDSYKLNVVGGFLGIDAFDHHQAGADALACAQVVLALSARLRQPTLAGLWPDAGPAPEPVDTGASKFFGRGYSSKVSELPAANPEASPGHPLFGQHIIFTGDLKSMGRWEAMEAAARCGAHNGAGVTKKTTVLVVCGVTGFAPGYDPARGSSKERKAQAYRDKGQDIVMITEDDFLLLTAI